jgi:hypothetical protein
MIKIYFIKRVLFNISSIFCFSDREDSSAIRTFPKRLFLRAGSAARPARRHQGLHQPADLQEVAFLQEGGQIRTHFLTCFQTLFLALFSSFVCDCVIKHTNADLFLNLFSKFMSSVVCDCVIKHTKLQIRTHYSHFLTFVKL